MTHAHGERNIRELEERKILPLAERLLTSSH